MYGTYAAGVFRPTHAAGNHQNHLAQIIFRHQTHKDIYTAYRQLLEAN